MYKIGTVVVIVGMLSMIAALDAGYNGLGVVLAIVTVPSAIAAEILSQTK